MCSGAQAFEREHHTGDLTTQRASLRQWLVLSCVLSYAAVGWRKRNKEGRGPSPREVGDHDPYFPPFFLGGQRNVSRCRCIPRGAGYKLAKPSTETLLFNGSGSGRQVVLGLHAHRPAKTWDATLGDDVDSWTLPSVEDTFYRPACGFDKRDRPTSATLLALFTLPICLIYLPGFAWVRVVFSALCCCCRPSWLLCAAWLFYSPSCRAGNRHRPAAVKSWVCRCLDITWPLMPILQLAYIEKAGQLC